MHEDFETTGVLRELEESHDADYREELEIGVRPVGGEEQVDVEGGGGHQVDDIYRRLEIGHLVRAGQKSDHDLNREPDVAHRLNDL